MTVNILDVDMNGSDIYITSLENGELKIEKQFVLIGSTEKQIKISGSYVIGK